MMNRIILVLKSIKNLKREKKTNKEVFLIAEKYLKKGTYYLSNNTFFLASNCFEKILHLFNLYTCVNGEGLLNKIHFACGAGKIVLFFDNYICGFYKRKTLYIEAKNNYRNVKELSYPHLGKCSFNDENLSITMPKIPGKSFFDSFHDKIIIDFLFEQLKVLPKIKAHDKIQILQHGDCKRENIIWTDEESFFFIDLDGCKYLPILFDFIHYCANIHLTFENMIAILQDRAQFIMDSIGYCCDNNTLIDDILEGYLMFYEKIGCCYGDFDFFCFENTAEYKKTVEVLTRLRDKGKH